MKRTFTKYPSNYVKSASGYVEASSNSNTVYVPFINDEPVEDGYDIDERGFKCPKFKEFSSSYSAIQFIRDEIDSIIDTQGADGLSFGDCYVMKGYDGIMNSVWCALDEPRYAKLNRENMRGNARRRW